MFSGQSTISGGRKFSSNHPVSSAGGTLVPSVDAVIGRTPSLMTSTSISPTGTA